MKPKFIEGCKERGHDREDAATRSGATGRRSPPTPSTSRTRPATPTWLTRPAYLKAHYPSEFMAAAAEPKPRGHQAADALHERVQAHGHPRAWVPTSTSRCAPSRPTTPGDVRFGLGAVKGVGEAAVESIIAERNANGRFKDIYDLMERVNFSAVNRKCFENLAYAGGVRLDIGLPPRQVLRCGRARQYAA